MGSFFLFLAVILSIYALFHAYAFIKIRVFFLLKRPGSATLLAVFLCLFSCPILGRVLASYGMEQQAVWILYAGYEWAALLFLFVSAHALTDALRFFLFLAGRAVPRMRVKVLARRLLFVGASAAAVAAFAYGHFEARTLRVDRINIPTSKLPPSVERLRVVQISDLHFSAVNSIGLATSVAHGIEALAPDLLVATGDVVDRGITDEDGVAGIFRSLEAPLGKYAILGNHEFYHGVDSSTRFLQQAGFRVLRGEVVKPRSWLSVAGVDDEAAERAGGYQGQSPEDLLERISRDDLVLFLRHRPLVHETNRGRFDLQLSGHTHGGQIFPFSLVVALAYPYLRGAHDVGEGSMLYVSRGTGTWGPPIRVGSPPEITLIEFHRHPVKSNNLN